MGPVFNPEGTRIVYTVKPSMGERGGTWYVPVLGGEPTRILANAEAMSFVPAGTGPPRIMFSEYGEGAHLSIMTSNEDRSAARTIYAPPGIDGMAHRSYLSPDGKNVLVVEMDGGWLPCRLVPFDGGAPAKVVGPSPGQCTTAAWSPDGRWMYFSANTGNGYQIWRQTFPDGVPEQISSGAGDEQGISFAPDGRSFVTAIGSRQSTLWIHDHRGDRQITSRGFASLPRFSADGRKLYYLLRSRANRRFVSGELWSANVETGQQERLLPNFLMEHYGVSPDGNRVVFAAIDEAGHSPVWLATLDGRTAPRRLTTIDATRTFFGINGDVFFLGLEDETKKFVYRVKEDGTGLQKALPIPVGYFYDVSPDGKSLAVLTGMAATVYPAGGGAPTPVCTICGAAGGENRGVTPPVVSWSPDAKFVYLNVRGVSKIYAVPLQPGQNLPPLPPAGIRSAEEADALRGARIIAEPLAFVGGNPSIYAFPRVTSLRNIYRVSGLH
jgi:Tol biopolymer transport system component